MDIKDLIRQRKFEAFAIEADTLVEFFQPTSEGHIRVPHFQFLPEDAVLWRVHFDDQSDSFVFVFLHRTFQSVPVGGRPTVRPAAYFVVELIPTEDSAPQFKKASLDATKPEEIEKNVTKLKDHLKDA